jgi:hypothetical protein
MIPRCGFTSRTCCVSMKKPAPSWKPRDPSPTHPQMKPQRPAPPSVWSSRQPKSPATALAATNYSSKFGEGGCGVVYMAEQEEPVRRRVALKVIKLGMDTKEVIARFEAERQALAMMDHPNIANVLENGATDTGRLWENWLIAHALMREAKALIEA